MKNYTILFMTTNKDSAQVAWQGRELDTVTHPAAAAARCPFNASNAGVNKVNETDFIAYVDAESDREVWRVAEIVRAYVENVPGASKPQTFVLSDPTTVPLEVRGLLLGMEKPWRTRTPFRYGTITVVDSGDVTLVLDGDPEPVEV